MSRMGILDWGIGGLGFWTEWKKHRPKEGVVYLSDSGYEPYGMVPEERLCKRVEEIIICLRRDFGVTHLVVACNAASTVLETGETSGVEVCGIIHSAVRLVESSIPVGPISIAGGRRTIESGIYQRLLPRHNVQGIIAQPLSAMVESGQLDGAETERMIREVLGSSRPNLLLACTHYAALAETIRACFPAIRLYDPVPGLVLDLLEKWPSMDGKDHFLTSGSIPEMMRTAQAAFGVEMKDATTALFG